MKRLALLLATSVLGTGCFVSSNNTTTTPAGGTLDLAWNFVRTTPAGTKYNYTCTDAGLDNVLVQTSTGQQWQLNCTGSGGTIYDVDPGTLTVTVTGRRGAASLYSSQFTASFGSNGAVTQLNADVYGILDDMDIYALFRSKLGADVGWSTCALAGVQELTYVIQDWRGTTNASGTVACTDPAGLSFTGNGALERDNYIIRLMGFPSSTATTETFDSATTAVNPTCSGQAFNHFGSDIAAAGWNVVLYDVSTNATVCP